MKRAPELRSLSVEHHHGLVAARHLRLAAEGQKPLAETVRQFLTAWQEEIQPHFRAEEEILLPVVATVLPADDPQIVQTLVEHVALRRAVRDLRAATPEAAKEMAAWIGRALDDHIRFEERVLFPRIESLLSPEALAELGRQLDEVAHGSHCPTRG